MKFFKAIFAFVLLSTFFFTQPGATLKTSLNPDKNTIPDVKASGLTFIDLDREINKLRGSITIAPSKNETNISHYVIYWGQSKNKKQNTTPIAELSVSDGDDVIFEFEKSRAIPQAPKATHLLVFTKNESGEMKSGISKEISDRGAPVFIKAGSYIMGSDSGRADEKPQHRVTFEQGFYMLDHEVTASEYALCVSNSDCTYEGSTSSPLRTYKVSGKENFPINYINWFDAEDYASWFSKKYNKKYRLCTEKEWEYVARAGTQTPWSCGVNSLCIESAPWFGDSSEVVPYQTMKGSPNPWGVYDIHDNVYEWIKDGYKPYPTLGGPELEIKQTDKSSARVIRGGTFNHTPANLRSAIRSYLSPVDRLSFLGIRLCAD